MGFASCIRYSSDVAQRRPTKLCTMSRCLLGWYTIYFRGHLLSDGILLYAKFTLRPRLAFSYIGSVTARHSSSRVSQTLRRGTRNGITELSHRAPPILGWTAITLGIAPHSSLWPPYVIGQAIYIFILCFLLSSSFLLFFRA